MVYSMVYSIVYSIVYRVVVYSMVVYSMVYSIVYSGLARLASGKGPNREKFNLMMDRRTDRQVQVLSCAFARPRIAQSFLSLSLSHFESACLCATSQDNTTQ